MTWNGQMSFPVELTLHAFPEGIRLCREPIDEVENLRVAQQTWKNLPVPMGEKVIPEMQGDLLDIRAEYKSTGASEFGLLIHGNAISYSTRARTIHLGSSLDPMR